LSAVSILLASASPRRRLMLESQGFDVTVVPPPIDDARAPIAERDERRLVEALAWFKAAQVLADPATESERRRAEFLIAADTMCVADGRAIGKPRDADEARAMIASLAGRRHAVMTGVCLIALPQGTRRLFSDVAFVEVGVMAPGMLDEHLASGRWRGRAGGYNFAEVVDAGWPIVCEGDPTTVMGLPMRRLVPMLRGAPSSFEPSPRRVA
jgi:septum formation protein